MTNDEARLIQALKNILIVINENKPSKVSHNVVQYIAEEALRDAGETE